MTTTELIRELGDAMSDMRPLRDPGDTDPDIDLSARWAVANADAYKRIRQWVQDHPGEDHTEARCRIYAEACRDAGLEDDEPIPTHELGEAGA